MEISLRLPHGFQPSEERFARFLTELEIAQEPITFECFGNGSVVEFQMVASPGDARLVESNLRTYFPEAVITSSEGRLLEATDLLNAEYAGVFEFGLEQDFIFQLNTNHAVDPFVGIVGALSDLLPDCSAIYQIIFQPSQTDWVDSFRRAYRKEDDSLVFEGAEEVVRAAEQKTRTPLFSVVARIAAFGDDAEGVLYALARLAGGLRGHANPGHNAIIPLENDTYDLIDHVDDVVLRQTRRCGMILNRDELLGFVHLPSAEVQSPLFSREVTNTRRAPEANLTTNGARGLFLGENLHHGETNDVVLTPENRIRHMHVIGASGTGKTTLLNQLIRDDIESGQGLAVLDPHGDQINRILGMIPEHRIDDVVLLDPGDEKAAVGFNVLVAHSDAERTILASDLVAIFRRLSDSWGDRMNVVLQNAILAFLESDVGGTLADLQRFLINDDFRDQFLQTVRDPDVVFYWREVFRPRSSQSTIDAIVTRLEIFLAPKQVRYIVGQKRNTLDFSDIMDSGKILLARLPQGIIGRENAALLGSLIVSKIQQAAMTRMRLPENRRRDFWCYIDEFQNFITPSMAEILTEARKLRLGLILAHQELGQLNRESQVAPAVMGSGVRVVFRVTDADARTLAQGFQHFEAEDVQALEKGQAICRIERSDHDFNLHVPYPMRDPVDEEAARKARKRAIKKSRKTYATKRKELDQMRRAELPSADPGSNEADSVAMAQPEKPMPVKSTPTVDALPPEKGKTDSVDADQEETLAGVGGDDHKEVQAMAKAIGEKLGFRAVIEEPTPDGAGKVDVALHSEHLHVAVEVRHSTSATHELRNARQRIEAGFDRVILVALTAKIRKRTAERIEDAFGSDTELVTCTSIGGLRGLLESLPLPEPVSDSGSGASMSVAEEAPPSKSTLRRGYKVTRKFAQHSPQDQQALEAVALELVAKALRGEDME